MRPPNIALIGYRGSGKSTLAPLLATRLDWVPIELDESIARKHGRSISEIFEKEGEATFRRLESEALTKILTSEQQVISTGGGVILTEENRKLLSARSWVVWLCCHVETLFLRLKEGTVIHRPALTSLTLQDEIKQLLAIREPLYRQTSNFTVDTSMSTPDDMVTEILSAWNASK